MNLKRNNVYFNSSFENGFQIETYHFFLFRFLELLFKILGASCFGVVFILCSLMNIHLSMVISGVRKEERQ